MKAALKSSHHVRTLYDVLTQISEDSLSRMSRRIRKECSIISQNIA